MGKFQVILKDKPVKRKYKFGLKKEDEESIRNRERKTYVEDEDEAVRRRNNKKRRVSYGNRQLKVKGKEELQNDYYILTSHSTRKRQIIDGKLGELCEILGKSDHPKKKSHFNETLGRAADQIGEIVLLRDISTAKDSKTRGNDADTLFVKLFKLMNNNRNLGPTPQPPSEPSISTERQRMAHHSRFRRQPAFNSARNPPHYPNSAPMRSASTTDFPPPGYSNSMSAGMNPEQWDPRHEPAPHGTFETPNNQQNPYNHGNSMIFNPYTCPASGGGLQNQDCNQSQTADNTLNRNHYQHRSQQGNTNCSLSISQEAERANRRESTDERNYDGVQAAPQTASYRYDAGERMEPPNLPPPRYDQPSTSLDQCQNQPNYGFQTAINDDIMRDVNVQAIILRQGNKALKRKGQPPDLSTISGPINEEESSVEEVRPKRGKGRPAHHNKEENKMLADKAIGICDNFDEQQNKMEALEFVETTAIQLILKEFDKKPPANGRTPLKSSRPFPRDWRPGTVNLPELLDVPEKLAAYLAERIEQFQIIEKRARESIRGEFSRDKSKKDLSNAISDYQKGLEEFKEDYRSLCNMLGKSSQLLEMIATDFQQLQKDVATFNLDEVHVPLTLDYIKAKHPGYKGKYAKPSHISNILSRENDKRLKEFCQNRTGKIGILHQKLRQLRRILDRDDAVNTPARLADVPVVDNEEIDFAPGSSEQFSSVASDFSKN